MPGCKCKICGKKIKGIYSRYGGQACAACAAFFIRTYYKNYVCKNDKMCLAIPSLKGAKCRKCRLIKCTDIGMQLPNKSPSSLNGRTTKTFHSEIYKEYLIIAKKLYALLVAATNNPQILLNYYLRNDLQLFNDANAFFFTAANNPNIHVPSYVGNWATLFQTNQISIAEIHLLFYSVISHIKFPWLSAQDQQMMAFFQRKSFDQFLIRSPFSSQEVKDGFAKITEYFQKQYEKYFATQKQNDNSVKGLPPTSILKCI